jgi:hypothetical protein
VPGDLAFPPDREHREEHDAGREDRQDQHQVVGEHLPERGGVAEQKSLEEELRPGRRSGNGATGGGANSIHFGQYRHSKPCDRQQTPTDRVKNGTNQESRLYR